MNKVYFIEIYYISYKALKNDDDSLTSVLTAKTFKIIQFFLLAIHVTIVKIERVYTTKQVMYWLLVHGCSIITRERVYTVKLSNRSYIEV